MGGTPQEVFVLSEVGVGCERLLPLDQRASNSPPKKSPHKGGLEDGLLEEGGSEGVQATGEPQLCPLNLHAT